MKRPLQNGDFVRAAAALEVPVNVVKAVTEVEARGQGFYPGTDEPIILFERHIFSRLTNRKYDLTHPDISNRVAGGYGSSAGQHRRLQRAAKLDRHAALGSASWGLFQIMGFNYDKAGFSKLQHFINAMYRSEGAQLDAFVNFVKSDPVMWQALKDRNWAKFAERYNGPGYRRNQYDTKLAKAYARLEGA